MGKNKTQAVIIEIYTIFYVKDTDIVYIQSIYDFYDFSYGLYHIRKYHKKNHKNYKRTINIFYQP